MSKEVISKFINDCNLSPIPESEAMTVVTLGLPEHGKSSYKVALFKQLQALAPRYIPDFALIPQGSESLARWSHLKDRLDQGLLPAPTEEGDEQHLAVLLSNLPSHLAGRNIRRLVGFLDFPGEYFQSGREQPIPDHVMAAVGNCPMPWLFFRTDHPTTGRPKDLPPVFQRIVQALGMPGAGRSNQRRPFLIVLSCGDRFLDKLPASVQQYLREDELSELQTGFDVAEYMQRAEAISQELASFLSEKFSDIAIMVNSAKTQGIDLKFCVCSATGGIANGGKVDPKSFRPMRVLAPLFWCVYFQCDFAPKRPGKVAVVVQADKAKPKIEILGEQLSTYLSSFGLKQAYYMGNVRTQMGDGVGSHLPPLNRSFPHLLCPLLDPLCHRNGFSGGQRPDLIVVLLDRLPFDYEDVKRHPLATRILWCGTELDLLNQLDENRMVVRDANDFPAVQNEVVRLLSRD